MAGMPKQRHHDFCRTGGHQIIGITQLSDAALCCALQTPICEICRLCRLLHEKLKQHRKNRQITTNYKHFTVENGAPLIPRHYAHTGKSITSKLETFFLKIANLYLSYSMDIQI